MLFSELSESYLFVPKGEDDIYAVDRHKQVFSLREPSRYYAPGYVESYLQVSIVRLVSFGGTFTNRRRYSELAPGDIFFMNNRPSFKTFDAAYTIRDVTIHTIHPAPNDFVMPASSITFEWEKVPDDFLTPITPACIPDDIPF